MPITRVISRSYSERDPLLRQSYDVELPKGYRRVYEGAVKPGDLYLDHVAICADGFAHWLPIDHSDLESPVYSHADAYFCVVRADNPVAYEAPCERCGGYARRWGCRFCPECCDVVRRTARVS